MLPEKLPGNFIQLRGDLPEILIQIQGSCTDQVATQIEHAIRGTTIKAETPYSGKRKCPPESQTGG